MNLIDLSQTISEQTPVFPGDGPVFLEKRKSFKEDGCVSHRLTAGLHVATHIDLPMHFMDCSKTAVDYPVAGFAGRGVLLDVRGEDPIAMKPHYADIIRQGDIVLLHTGHDQYFTSNPEKYYSEYPSVCINFARFLADRKIRMLGMDSPSPDHSPYDIHKILFPAGIFMLENLTNLMALENAEHFEVIALPLKITAEASLVRAVALLP